MLVCCLQHDLGAANIGLIEERGLSMIHLTPTAAARWTTTSQLAVSLLRVLIQNAADDEAEGGVVLQMAHVL